MFACTGNAAAVYVSRVALVHSLGCGFQIKGYGRRGVTDKGEGGGGVVNVKILLNRCR